MSDKTPRDPAAYLAKKAAENGPLAASWAEMEGFYDKRLWHQLTVALLKLTGAQGAFCKDGGAELYDQFIADFETKINPLSLVEICVPIWQSMPDKDQVLAFIEKIGEKVKNHHEAFCLIQVLLGTLYLEHFKKADKTKQIIEEVDKLLDDVKGVGKVHAQFYYLASDYYKQQGDHEKYYRSSLKYLGCIEASSLDLQTQRVQACHLSLAAILGKGIYNFGELLAHPILQSLKGSDDEWLVQFLYAFNSGDVAKYNKLKPKWSSIPDLNGNQEVMFEKLCLLALMEMAFQRPAQERVIPFVDISKTTELPVNQIEILVMKALAQGLVKGHIDQVDQTVFLTWVQPRVLDMDQLKTICGKIELWTTNISSLENIVQTNAGEILTA